MPTEFDDDSIARISRAVLLVEDAIVTDDPMRNMTLPRSNAANLEFVRITSSIKTGNYYSGKYQLRNETTGVFTDSGDVWVIHPNGRTLETKIYPARRSGLATAGGTERPGFVVTESLTIRNDGNTIVLPGIDVIVLIPDGNWEITPGPPGHAVISTQGHTGTRRVLVDVT